MITFLQKYQRAMTVAITVCVVSTFVFFGTSRAFLSHESEAQNDVVCTCNGIDITRRQMKFRSFFLGSEITDTQDPKLAWAALLNPGFVSELIIETGLAEELIQRDAISQAWIRGKYAKESVWSGYRHPQMGYLNFSNMISQLSPPFQHTLKQYQQTEPKDVVVEKLNLWKQARKTPFHVMRTLIRYQEKSAGIESAGGPASRLLQPFGYQSLQEWFGPRFIYLCTQVISQGAKEAEKLGYTLSNNMAEKLLDEKISELWQEYKKSQPDLTFIQFRQQLLVQMGVELPELIALWRDCSLFEKLCYHEGGRFLVDTVTCNRMASFLSDRVEVDTYELTQDFHLNSLRDMCQLQLYWQMTCGSSLTELEVPLAMRSVDELLRTAPELMAYSVKLNVRSLSLDALRTSIGIRGLLQWQAKDLLWPLLLEQSKELCDVEKAQMPSSAAERMQCLLSLSSSQRETLDRISIRWLVEHEPSYFQDYLQSQTPTEQTYRLPLADTRQPLEGIASARELIEKLQKQTLLCPYTQDGQTIYSIELKSEVQEQLLGFGEVKTSGILDGLLTKRLESHYETMKISRSASIFKDGKVQPFKTVQDYVMVDLFQNLLVGLQHQMAKNTTSKVEMKIQDPRAAAELVSWRFWNYMKSSLEKIQKAEGLPKLPWSWVASSATLNREQTLRTPLQAVFDLEPEMWLSLVQNGKPLDKLVCCRAHIKVDADPFTLEDQLDDTMTSSINRLALQKWLESIKLDVDMALIKGEGS